MADILNLKAILEAYGIGVRAGVLTPCLQDENEFRRLLGLQPAPLEVEKDWSDSEGTRRPITLQRPSLTEELPEGAKDELGNIINDGEPSAIEGESEGDEKNAE